MTIRIASINSTDILVHHPNNIGFHTYWFKLKLKINYDSQSVGQSVLLSGTHLGPAANFFLHEIFSRQWQVRYFLAPYLTRGRFCNLLLLLVITRTVPLGSESRGTQDNILLSQFLRLTQPGGPGPRIYIPHEKDGPDIPPDTGFPFRRFIIFFGILCYVRLTEVNSF
jgi:hypothetical protein